MGSRLLRHWLHHPLRDCTIAQRAAAAIGALLDAPPRLRASARCARHCGRCRTSNASPTRIALLSARPRDLSGLRDTLAALPSAARTVELPRACTRARCSSALHAALEPPPECLDLLAARHRAGAGGDGARRRRDRRGYDAELDELRDISENCGQFLIDLETRERARTGIANLRVEYNQVHGFYIEVTHGQTDKVPDDYRRRQTLKNAERYITPELKAFEDKALSAQERALAREKLLYDALLQSLLAAHPGTASASPRRWRSSTCSARSPSGARALDWSPPEFVADAGIDIERGPASGRRSAGRAASSPTTAASQPSASCC